MTNLLWGDTLSDAYLFFCFVLFCFLTIEQVPKGLGGSFVVFLGSGVLVWCFVGCFAFFFSPSSYPLVSTEYLLKALFASFVVLSVLENVICITCTVVLSR